MLYCCETCGKKYSTEEEALDCERVHAEEKAKREEIVKAREGRAKEVDSLFKTFYDLTRRSIMTMVLYQI